MPSPANGLHRRREKERVRVKEEEASACGCACAGEMLALTHADVYVRMFALTGIGTHVLGDKQRIVKLEAVRDQAKAVGGRWLG